MDKPGFFTYLEGRKQNEAQIQAAIQLVEMFETFQQQQPRPEPITSQLVWDFSDLLIQNKNNTYDNYLALARYAVYTKNNDLFVPVLELLDGEESLDNLHKKLGELYDEAVQAEIFQDFGLPPLGTPTNEKPKYTAAVMHRMTDKFGEDGCKDLIKDSLRTLPDEGYLEAKNRFEKSTSVDDFLDKEGQRFLDQLETLRNEDKLFFAQRITPEVMDYLRQHPEIYRGEWDGAIVYEIKIPFLTEQYLQEEDPQKRRYYYCHCPWARESLIRDNVTVPAAFCNCSAGFHKKKWEIIFGQPLHAEVLESVLMGDERCRFAIHLPEGVK
jgi:hypothetical protein